MFFCGASLNIPHRQNFAQADKFLYTAESKRYFIGLQNMKKPLFPFALALIGGVLIMTSAAYAAIDDCRPGYKFNRNSGVGCQQENCGSVPGAHYSYEGHCICGSSGSINENPDDPNKACSYRNDHESCPGCVYACVHVDEECPDQNAEGFGSTTSLPPEVSATDINLLEPTGSRNTPAESDNANLAEPSDARTPDLLSSLAVPAESGRTCEQECKKLTRGGNFDEVLEASGTYPACRCVVDNKDKNNRVTQTVRMDGDIRTIYTFDPETGRLIKKDTISMSAERERIRQQLGYKYDEDTIDSLLDDEKINQWFTDKMLNIETNASMMTPAFWWQHMVALWDHGYGNSADFVDTYRFGRCGDSMEWLEREITANLGLTDKHDNKSEAVLSVTGEKYNNAINHTALIVRPAGFSNIEWADTVSELISKTQSGGLTEADIRALDPRLLDAKVLDPYFKKQTTVREFIKGWSVIKIS